MSTNSDSLQIDRFFDKPLHPLPLTPNSFYRINVHLNPPAINNKGESVSTITILVGQNLYIEPYNPNVKAFADWYPKTNMTTFEHVNPFEQNYITINQGQGIGVLIFERIPTYLKLRYDPSTKNGVSPASYAIWNREATAERLLYKDLQIGYNVLLITENDQVHDLFTGKTHTVNMNSQRTFPIVLTDNQSNIIQNLGHIDLTSSDTPSTLINKIKVNKPFSISFLPNQNQPGTILGLSRMGYMVRPFYYTNNNQHYSQVFLDIPPVYQTDTQLSNKPLSQIMVHNPATLEYASLWEQMNGIGLKFDL